MEVVCACRCGYGREELHGGACGDGGVWAGDVFDIGPGHDSWVVGDEPYISIHLLGAEAYATVEKS